MLDRLAIRRPHARKADHFLDPHERINTDIEGFRTASQHVNR